MMEFLEELERDVHPLYLKLREHPFNVELAAGNLPEEKFRFYISQDVFYIGEYSRALAALASIAPSHEELMEFISFAKEGLEIERALHSGFMESFNIAYPKEIALATEAYANFLLASVAYKSYAEAIAGLLPCFWLYNKVAVHIYSIANKENKYQKWIDTYAGAEFDKTTSRLKEITQRIAHENNQSLQNKMKNQFMRSAKYEWLFWESAYKLIWFLP